jgi:hypothetical protein
MYLDSLNNAMMVGFANTSAHEIVSFFLFTTTYGSITAVDLAHNFDTMRNAWHPHQSAY